MLRLNPVALRTAKVPISVMKENAVLSGRSTDRGRGPHRRSHGAASRIELCTFVAMVLGRGVAGVTVPVFHRHQSTKLRLNPAALRTATDPNKWNEEKRPSPSGFHHRPTAASPSLPVSGLTTESNFALPCQRFPVAVSQVSLLRLFIVARVQSSLSAPVGGLTVARGGKSHQVKTPSPSAFANHSARVPSPPPVRTSDQGRTLHSCDDGNRPRCHRCPPFAGPVSPEYKFPARIPPPPGSIRNRHEFQRTGKAKTHRPGAKRRR